MNNKVYFLAVVLLGLFSCKKLANQDDNSTIKATILVKNYSKIFVMLYEYAGEKVNTNALAEFEFKHLSKVSY